MSMTLTIRVLILVIMLGACSAGGYTMRLNRPSLGLFEPTATAVAGAAPSVVVQTTAVAATPESTQPSSAGGLPTTEGGMTYEDPEGRFELWYGDSWRVADVPELASDVDASWLLRLQRGEPDAPTPPGADTPPNGANFDLAIVNVEPGTSLAEWAASHLPIDTSRFSITADAIAGTTGAEQYDSVFREGQILPYFGRWREWLVPDPRHEGRVYVLRVTAYGREDQWEMSHGKVVARTLLLR